MSGKENKNNIENVKIKELKEKLFLNRENLGHSMPTGDIRKAVKFCEKYKKFLDLSKTEREVVDYAVTILRREGFTEFREGKRYTTGDKLFYLNRGKALVAAIIGKEGLDKGVNILASHIDSPRIDLKQNPLYEDAELALFKTHYYGGIKKYQWTTVPLALHGVIVKADGTIVKVNIGESEDDPVFVITDLLPHLAQQQYKRPSADLVKGEELNLLIGSMPFRSGERTKESDLVKLNIMNVLFEKYGIVESDFRSAELEAVPAFKATDVGFDRSLIGAYGQDDRVCAYTTLMATVACRIPTRTVVTVLADKEEVGSDGNTGLNSQFLEHFIEALAEVKSVPLRTVLLNSRCISADVSAAFDPTFANVLEKMNAPYLNHGAVLMKYTGSRGKSGTNDASAEYVGYIRSLFDENNVSWQTGMLGKVDTGGGGTVAKFISALNVDTIDVGVPMLSMHSPFEITAKKDIYMAYKAFTAFANSK
ncbi:MAG: aminopeptidase [Oscillospiraceae bacterium]|nr:aminopeptidase [Oscillospiraceae bacterium]